MHKKFFFSNFQAIDFDSTPNVQYVLSGTNSEDFRIQNFNGVGNIQVNRGLDYETRSSYNLFVTTTDGQNSNIPGASASVFIEVLVSSDGYLQPGSMNILSKTGNFSGHFILYDLTCRSICRQNMFVFNV